MNASKPIPRTSHTKRRPARGRQSDGAGHRSAAMRETTERLLTRLAELEPGTRAHADLRNEIVELNMNLVGFVCGRYTRRPDLREDLRQVAAIGLIKAIDRYRPGSANGFLAFAMPTITGEVKRYFRDHTWDLHARRGEQELFLSLIRAKDELTIQLGREPSPADIAEHLGLPLEDVRSGLAVAAAHRAGSLDRPTGEDGTGTRHDSRGAIDPALELAENVTALRPLIDRLPERERRILGMRFWDDMTQAQIGEQLGISQMHISRLLNQTCERLREGLLAI